MKFKNKSGITLIALVVTIIVLLILAGISISMLTGQNGILNRASEAKEKTKEAQKDEIEKLQNYEDTIKQYTGVIPEGLEVGSKVLYSPSGTYNWQAKYCSTTQTEDVTLSSESGKDFNLTEWKVLSIENGRVELVPVEPTKGNVHLGEAQGYNNGVKLLNDACNSLYSNKSKGITARSLNIDDIEKYMKKDKLAEAHLYTNEAKYKEQVTSTYTINKNYPIIYKKESLSVIDGVEIKSGLDMSEQLEFVEKTDKNAADGLITTATMIQPYQTYWMEDESYMKEAFRTESNGINYYNLVMNLPTNYWLASRCVDTGSSNCNFNIYRAGSGGVVAYLMQSSGGAITYNSDASLFPVVSLNATCITGDTTNGFVVKVN